MGSLEHSDNFVTHSESPDDDIEIVADDAPEINVEELPRKAVDPVSGKLVATGETYMGVRSSLPKATVHNTLIRIKLLLRTEDYDLALAYLDEKIILTSATGSGGSRSPIDGVQLQSVFDHLLGMNRRLKFRTMCMLAAAYYSTKTEIGRKRPISPGQVAHFLRAGRLVVPAGFKIPAPKEKKQQSQAAYDTVICSTGPTTPQDLANLTNDQRPVWTKGGRTTDA